MKTRNRSIFHATTAVIVSSALSAAILSAQETRSWANTDGGIFGVAGNWSGGVPGPTDSALFDLGGESFTVTFDDSHTNNRLTVRNGAFIFDLSNGEDPSHTYQLTNISSPQATQSAITIGVDNGNNAELELRSGTLIGVQARVGWGAGSTGQLTVGQGAQLTTLSGNVQGVEIGFSGNGSLTIENGGEVISRRGSIGFETGSTGSVVITGADSEWRVNNSFTVGRDGNAQLTVSNGATLKNTGGTAPSVIAINSGSNGEVLVTGSGSIWDVSQSIYIGGNATVAGGVGVLNVTEGAAVTAGGTITVWNGGTLGGNSTITTTEVINYGSLAPGISSGTLTAEASIGTLTINGNLTQEASGILDLRIGGATAGLYDVLSVSGLVTLGGSISVTLVDDFLLIPYQTFQILTSGASPTGTFAGLGEGDLVGTYNGIDLFITYAPELNFDSEDFGVGLYSIPEPSALPIAAALGALLVVVVRRFRRNR